MLIVLGFLVPIAGVCGALGGQMLASRRDDARWTREREREDLRWRRDAVEQQARRDHEREVHWRDQRLTAYAALSLAMSNWRMALVDASMQVDNGEALLAETVEAVRRTEASALEAYGMLGLLATEDVEYVAADMMSDYTQARAHAFQDESFRTDDLLRRLQGFDSVARSSLGITRSVSPSPPSATTS